VGAGTNIHVCERKETKEEEEERVSLCSIMEV
jgi:hypothetical protein